MQNEIEALIEAINADYYDWQNCRMGPENRTEIQARMYDEFVQALRIEEGRKYIKIIKQGSVWGFIQKEDDAKGFRRVISSWQPAMPHLPVTALVATFLTVVMPSVGLVLFTSKGDISWK